MRKFRLIAPLVAGMLVLGACSSGPGASGEPDTDCPEAPANPGEGIVVTSLWGGAEEEAFVAVLDAFTAATGIEATYEPNRTDYATVLRNRIQGGNPPDVAIIPGIGFLRSFARDGSIVPLSCYGIDVDAVAANYVPGMMDAGNVDDVQYALMAKVNSKATIWYDPSRFTDLGVEPAGTWDDLVALSGDIAAEGAVPWSLAAGDGWTLTDWFEAVYLKMAGPEAYDKLFSADGDWTDASVADAITKMYGELLTADNVDGGTDGALATAFVDGIAKVFGTGATAEMYCCGGFVGGIAASDDVNPNLTYGTDIAWFPFPTIQGGSGGIGDITYGGDVIAGLTNREEVGKFMEFMASVDAGTTWAEGGTIVSPLKGVSASVYPASVQAEAEQIASATSAHFDGGDLMPAGPDLGAMLQSAFRGEDLTALLSAFQTEVASAWAQE